MNELSWDGLLLLSRISIVIFIHASIFFLETTFNAVPLVALCVRGISHKL